MITPHLLSVENWSTWTRGRIRLDVPGITFIRGNNLDTRPPQPNGAGKSSLANSIYAALFGEHQLMQKKKLKGITRDHTRIRQSFTVDGKKIVTDLRGTDYRVVVDGVPLDSRVKGQDRVTLLNMMNTNADLWSSTVHVNGIASNPLVRGNSASRCQFLERAFDLNRWESSFARVADQIATFKRIHLDLDKARAELARLPEKHDADDPAGLQREADDLRTVIDRLRTRADDVRERAAVARSLPARPPKPERHYARLVHDLEQAVVDGTTVLRDRQQHRDARRRRDELRQRLAAIPRPPRDADDPDELCERVRVLDERIVMASGEASAVPRVLAWARLAEKIARRHGIHYGTLEHLRALSQTWVQNLRAGASSCPVCGGDLREPMNHDDLLQMQRMVHGLPEGKLPTEVTMDFQLLIRKRDHVRGLHADAIDAARARRDRADLQKELSYVRVPPDPDQDVSDETVDALRARLARARDDLQAATAWRGVEHQEDARALAQQLERINDRIVHDVNRLSELAREIAEARVTHDQRTRLEERIEQLDAELVMQPAYRALHQAYSPTGMRLWLLSELLEALVEGLNEVASTMGDAVQFGYRLGRNRDLTITASNINGTFDVRLLSGAEGNMFCLNLLTVLLPMLPPQRRCSMLILDELDANCSDETVAVIARTYLPRLAQTVPSLFVITPNRRSVFDVPGAHQLTVTKHRGISSMEH